MVCNSFAARMRLSVIAVACALIARTAIAQTLVYVTDNVLQPQVKRLGINLGSRSRWGDAQILKNLIDNPGFEPGYYSSVVLADSGSTARTFRQAFWNTDQTTGTTGQPAGFWDGAEYEIVWGAAKGRTGHIASFTLAGNRNVFTLDADGVAPGPLDVMLVRKALPGIGGNTTIADTTTHRPGSPGKQSMHLDSAHSRYDFYMDSYWRDGDTSATRFMPVHGAWHVELWAKGGGALTDGAHVQFFREGTTPFLDKVKGLGSEWTKLEWDVDIPADVDAPRRYAPGEYRPILDVRIERMNSNLDGDLWVDDVNVYWKENTNPTVFSDAFVDRLRELRPGIVRDWSGQLGASLADEIGSPWARRTSGSRTDARAAGGWQYGLHEFLELARELGSEPWYVIPPAFSPDELRGLMEYLAAPADASHPYAMMRASAGMEQPWTAVFPTIHLEYGNELWGAANRSDPFQGASVNGGTRLGAIASDRFGILKGSPFYDSRNIDLIIGGQAGFAGRQQEIETNSTNHNTIALAPYFGTLDVYDNDADIFNPLFATPFYQAGPAGAMRQSKGFIGAGAKGSALAIYEINFHTTSGQTPIAIRNDFLTGMDGAIALPLAMLTYQRDLGAIDQCAFSALGYSFRMGSGEYAKVWGMLRDLYATGRKRPTWLGVELANTAIMGRAVATTQSGEDPSWTQSAINGIAAATNVHTVQSFAFNDGNQFGLILFNLDVNAPHQVQLRLPSTPEPTATMRQLAPASIHSDNEDSLAVAIATTQIGDFHDAYNLTLPPHSVQTITWRKQDITGVRGDAATPRASIAIASPAAPDAVVTYSVTSAGGLRLELVDLTGRVVAVLTDRFAEPGAGLARLDDDGRAVQPGCYFLRLVTTGGNVVRKVVVIR